MAGKMDARNNNDPANSQMLLRRDNNVKRGAGEGCVQRCEIKKRARLTGTFVRWSSSGQRERIRPAVVGHYWNCYEHIFPFDQHCRANRTDVAAARAAITSKEIFTR